jgi:hypothetical protein
MNDIEETQEVDEKPLTKAQKEYREELARRRYFWLWRRKWL